MVGEEEVTSNSEYNDLPESKGELVPLTANENFEPGPHLPAVAEAPHEDISFGMENARRYFMAQRLVDGADTAIGHRWSNLIEVVQNQRLAETQEQVETLFVAFAKNFIEIADLKRGRPMRKLSRPQLLLAYQTNTFH